jgi:hypothetical protein
LAIEATAVEFVLRIEPTGSGIERNVVESVSIIQRICFPLEEARVGLDLQMKTLDWHRPSWRFGNFVEGGSAFDSRRKRRGFGFIRAPGRFVQ